MDHLIEQLRSSSNTALQQKVTEAITIHETSFFRDMHPFKALRESVFPDIIQSAARNGPFRCGVERAPQGKNPTVSMILHQHFPDISNWRVRFIATDISRQILDKAGGRFSQLRSTEAYRLQCSGNSSKNTASMANQTDYKKF